MQVWLKVKTLKRHGFISEKMRIWDRKDKVSLRLHSQNTLPDAISAMVDTNDRAFVLIRVLYSAGPLH